MREYKLENTLGDNFAITYMEANRTWSIPLDESNSDYQQYLIDTNGGLPIPKEGK